MATAADDHEVESLHGAQIMLPALMNSPRKGVGRPSVLLDMRPLQGPSSARGVGAYARGLLSGLIENGFDVINFNSSRNDWFQSVPADVFAAIAKIDSAQDLRAAGRNGFLDGGIRGDRLFQVSAM